MAIVAAIYARKSTEQNVADDAKSVTRQIANAREYAARKGWIVNDDYVFQDDGISGAEFERRRGLSRLRGYLDHRAPFQILVVSENKSLGREMSETAYLIKQLDEAGVEVWGYIDDRCLTPRDSVAKLMSSVQSFSDEDHREKTSKRVHEAHTRLHRMGYVTGGRIFGYRNRDVMQGMDLHGRPLRSHVERVVDDVEAAVVRRIFELYDSGLGLKRIAKLLTLEHAPAPKSVRRIDGLTPLNAWAPSTVRTVLAREIYRGELVWNKTRKRTVWGKVNQRPRPEGEWMRTQVEHLRIVSDSLWFRVAARRREVEGKALRFASGRISGRPPKYATRNLLAGIASCGVCGGGLVVETAPRKGHRVAEYVCGRRRRNGACANTLHMAVETVNEAVLQAIEEHALTPEAIERVIRLTERDDAQEQQESLTRQVRDVERRIARLLLAIEEGGDVASLVGKLRELEAKRDGLQADIVELKPLPRLPAGVVMDRLAEWRRLLRQSTTQARAVLQRILSGRLQFTPREDGAGYWFTAPTRFDKLFAGVAAERPAFMRPASDVPWEGAEHLTADDTFDADYGRLLERATRAFYGKGMASPSGIEPESRP
jgi:DNA invertase Pin-like site-specific DNA recombinase